MSRAHGAQRISLPFGNPFRMIRSKGSSLSPKLLSLITLFEQTLAESLWKLKPANTSDVLSLSWMRHAMGCLSEMHANIKTLTNALQFPVTEWDEKWIDMYLNDSVKLLDICNGLTSELSWLEQNKLLLKYALHILASMGSSPSSDDLKRVHSSVQEWMEKVDSRSLKWESCSSILLELTTTLDVVKVKNSAKGKVLMRALYGVKVVTIFICSVLTAALSGSSKPLKDLHVSGEFLWAEVFTALQTSTNREIRYHLSLGKSRVLKELETIDAEVRKLQNLYANTEQVLTLEKTNSLKETSSALASNVEGFACELDSLSKQLDEFFYLVLAERDALLSSLRSPKNV